MVHEWNGDSFAVVYPFLAASSHYAVSRKDWVAQMKPNQNEAEIIYYLISQLNEHCWFVCFGLKSNPHELVRMYNLDAIAYFFFLQ